MSDIANKIVDRRYEFVLLFDVCDGNPNGDPDAGNLPRIDAQSLQGLVTDVCIKRKIRNAIAAMSDGQAGREIYFQTQDAVYEKRVLRLLHEEAYQQVNGGTVDKTAKAEKSGKDRMATALKARAWMCRQFYDVRTFGAVMSLKEFNCGQVRGPVQITFARSLDAIVPMELAITRKSVATPEEAQEQIRKHDAITGTMGRKSVVPYGLYRDTGFVNPYLARDTGFTYADLTLFFQAVQRMFELDRSASRGLMSVRGIHVFQHNSALGEAPAHLLLERVVTTALGPEAAPRSFADYRANVCVRIEDLPAGVSYRDLSTLGVAEGTLPWAD